MVLSMGGSMCAFAVCVCTYILYRYRYRDRYRQKRRTQAQIRISICVYTHRHKQEGYGIYSSCHGAADWAECCSSLSISHAFAKPGVYGRHGLVPSETEGHDSRVRPNRIVVPGLYARHGAALFGSTHVATQS